MRRIEIISRYFPGHAAEIKARLGDGDPRTPGRRSARSGHPGIDVQRIWPRAHAVDLDEHSALASEVLTAVAALLAALDEPPLPACADKP